MVEGSSQVGVVIGLVFDAESTWNEELHMHDVRVEKCIRGKDVSMT